MSRLDGAIHDDTVLIMSLDQLKLRLQGGFRPFVLHLSDGRKSNIPHPEFILLGKEGVALLRQDGLIETVDALHIVSVEDLPRLMTPS